MWTKKKNNLLEWSLNLAAFVRIFVDLSGITVRNMAAEFCEENTEANFRRFYCFQKYTIFTVCASVNVVEWKEQETSAEVS